MEEYEFDLPPLDSDDDLAQTLYEVINTNRDLMKELDGILDTSFIYLISAVEAIKVVITGDGVGDKRLGIELLHERILGESLRRLKEKHGA